MIIAVDPLYAELVSPVNSQDLIDVRKLWASVMIVALSDFLYGKPGSRKQLEARAWIFGDQSSPTSFDNICLLLGYSPDRVRRRILADELGDVAFKRYVRRLEVA